jgi:hypothetical protein
MLTLIPDDKQVCQSVFLCQEAIVIMQVKCGTVWDLVSGTYCFPLMDL